MKTAKRQSIQARTFLRYVQHYLAGALVEPDNFIKAIAAATKDGASPSVGLDRICEFYLHLQAPLR